MKAVVWHGKHDVRTEEVEDPAIVNPRDAIVEITRTAICGSDLHLYNGYIPTMKPGDVLGHEFMGRVVETGSAVKNRRIGERVVVPFTIACGGCIPCSNELWSCCENTNPNAAMAEKMYGHTTAGLFGYSHLTGGYWGGQAQYVRVPMADVGLFPVPETLTDEQVLFLTDIFPTGYMAAENCDIGPGDVIAIWGCGPVGQFAIRSAFLLGAGKVIAFDHIPERMEMARAAGATVIDHTKEDVLVVLAELTAGRGPDACIDAVGLEAHAFSPDALIDKAKQMLKIETDRPHVLRLAIQSCKAGGVVSVPGVYGGFIDSFPAGAFMQKGLTLRTGQTHMHRYIKPLLEYIEQGRIDPTFVITHREPISNAPQMYKNFAQHSDGTIKVVLDPAA
jgi:threonine dehydrogenase-like Zn-dependent dehydrogenase